MGKVDKDHPSPPLTYADGVRVHVNRCPYCHDDVAQGGELESLVCDGCLARHHAACWAESGVCGSCGAARPLSPQVTPIKGRAARLAGAALLIAFPITGFLAGAFEPTPQPAPVVARANVAVTLGVDVERFLGMTGATISRVWVGSPAWKAGLKVGDVIQSLDEHSVTSTDDFARALEGREAGTSVRLGLLRDAKDQSSVQLELVARVAKGSETHASGTDILGAGLEAYPDGGVQVSEILAGTLAQRVGLERGDRLESIDGRPTPTPGALLTLLEERQGQTIQLGVKRHYGKSEILSVPLGTH